MTLRREAGYRRRPTRGRCKPASTGLASDAPGRKSNAGFPALPGTVPDPGQWATDGESEARMTT